MTQLQQTNQTNTNIFRLAAALCLVLLINPGQYFNHKKPPAEGNGVGGGYLAEELISEGESDVLLTAASLDSVSEPETLAKIRILLCDSYMVQSGDNISTLATNLGLNQDTIISVNKITYSRGLQAGKPLKIPNQDGIFHTVKNGESLSSIAQKYNANTETIKTVNELFSDKVVTGTELFIPGARLDWSKLQEINGDLFIWPVNGAITSYYGWRRDPFNRGRRHFHNGIDIKGNTGTPVRAAMAGTVTATGYDNVFGNYVIINHHSGYRTLYGHMNLIRTRTGAYVSQGERIGDVGNTGQSTGSHLHFTVYKNGTPINPRALMR
ncbi:peptidoglycan DD-metalloendopeptidase family protein [Treponema sp. R80B11-R83G3]